MNDPLHNAGQHAFEYPPGPPSRRHGPRGYLDYQSYKPWLRDEFTFRCVYCLWREAWEGDGHHAFGVDHVQPQSDGPVVDLAYEDLVYACNTCNSTRRDVPLPVNLRQETPGRHLRMLTDGTIEARTAAGQELIELCRLNRPLLVAARHRILTLITVLQPSQNPEAHRVLRELFGFPPNLPNLAVLRPPGGNTRPDGIVQSYSAQRSRGELPEIY
jgi:hypothetical protein